MVTWSDIINSVLICFSLFVISFTIFICAYGVACIFCNFIAINERGRRLTLTGFLIGLPFGFTGIVAGFLTGESRAPAISAVVPAILTFISLIVVYMFGKGSLRSIIAGFAVFTFAADLLVGTILGSLSRERHDEAIASVEYQKSKAEQEFAIRQYRNGLGLPLEGPKPDLSGLGSEKQ